jgi:lysine 6-dehydrogenase
MQGAAAAADLASRGGTDAVTVVDLRPPAMPFESSKISYHRADLVRDPKEAASVLSRADACIVALPGSIAARALPAAIQARVPTVDMSFTPEVQDKDLDAAARKAGVPLLRDVGVAPGLSHLLAAESAEAVGGLTALTIYVGGLPKTPTADPFRHAVYFNALDLVSEYTRPARMRRSGKDLAPDPLEPAECESLVDGDLGALEAFPSDGLRTLLDSYPECMEMRELTLRWPGHLDYMRGLSRAGKLGGVWQADSAAERTAVDLERRFPGDQNPDWLLMEVHAAGRASTRSSRVLAGAEHGVSAMSRTTAFTATAAACALANGALKEPGLHPPETMGRVPALRDGVLADLRARGIVVERAQGLRVVKGTLPAAKRR